MAEPNLITESGRESMTVSDRIDLMRADLMQAPFLGIPDCSTTSAIHDIKVTVGLARNTITLYEQAVARGATDEQLNRGAGRFLSPVECEILAWRRGGHQELLRVRRAQRALRVRRAQRALEP